MPDSPDQIMHRLEQENRSLKNILKQKDKKLEQKDKKLEQKDKKLEQKDKKLEQKDKKLEQKDKKLEQKDKKLEQKDKKLEQKDKKLEQKDKTLKNILKQKDKKLEQKDRELGLERGLWKSRNDGWNPGKGPALHLLEVLDGIIRDGDKLRHVTLADGEQFRYMLERAKVFLTHSGQMPLFRDNASRTSDPGNRCKLYLRHALLLALIRKKDNPAQGVLAAFFGIDQTTVSRYIPVMDAMLTGILPTADNISEEVAAAPTKEDFKKIVPGPDGGEIFIDGTHCPVQRPSVKSVRRMGYSGKKKKFTNNTNVYANRDGVVIGISKSTVGSVGDITLLKERPMPFGKWEEAMHDPDLPESDRCHPFVDRGYQGIADHLPGTTPEIPYKKTRDTPLTPEQKKHNHRINSTRVLVEHTIGRLKRYARLADPYDGNAAGFNREFNVITGLVNLNLLWDCMEKGPPPPGQWKTSVDWDRACSQAPVK